MYEANFEQPPKKQPALPPQPQELPPLLPAHIEETIRSIALLHAEHHQNATPLQRAIDRITALVGRPRFIGILTITAASWIILNLLTAALGYRSETRFR
jgi:uncharacterized membrane protein